MPGITSGVFSRSICVNWELSGTWRHKKLRTVFLYRDQGLWFESTLVQFLNVFVLVSKLRSRLETKTETWFSDRHIQKQTALHDIAHVFG